MCMTLVSSLCNDLPQLTHKYAPEFQTLAVSWTPGGCEAMSPEALASAFSTRCCIKAHTPNSCSFNHTRSLVDLHNCILSVERFLSYPDDFTVDITPPTTHKFA